MGTIKIGGRVIQGNNITITGGCIIVDGIDITNKGDVSTGGICKVEVEGDIHNVTSDESIEVKGNVTGNVRSGGSVHCGDVGGSVNCGGSAHCGDIEGSINAGGSVKCSRRN